MALRPTRTKPESTARCVPRTHRRAVSTIKGAWCRRADYLLGSREAEGSVMVPMSWLRVDPERKAFHDYPYPTPQKNNWQSNSPSVKKYKFSPTDFYSFAQSEKNVDYPSQKHIPSLYMSMVSRHPYHATPHRVVVSNMSVLTVHLSLRSGSINWINVISWPFTPSYDVWKWSWDV